MQHNNEKLLESIINYNPETNTLLELGNRANHAINSIINILDDIDQNFEPEFAEDLQRRLYLSIKNRDYRKFEKGLENITLHERNKKNED